MSKKEEAKRQWVPLAHSDWTGLKLFNYFESLIKDYYNLLYSLLSHSNILRISLSLSLSLSEIKISIMASHLLRRALGSHSKPSTAFVAAMAFSSSATTIRATLFPGDGIGPEIAESVKQVGPSLSLSLSLSDSLCSPWKSIQNYVFFIWVWILSVL